AHRGHEGDLDQVEGRVSRRDGDVRSHDGLAEAVPEAAPADPGRGRLPTWRAPRRALRRRLDAAAPTQGLWRGARPDPEVPGDGQGGQPRPHLAADLDLGIEGGRERAQ